MKHNHSYKESICKLSGDWQKAIRELRAAEKERESFLERMRRKYPELRFEGRPEATRITCICGVSEIFTDQSTIFDHIKSCQQAIQVRRSKIMTDLHNEAMGLYVQ